MAACSGGGKKTTVKKKRGKLGRNGKAEEMKGVAEEMEERAPGLKELVPKRARGNPLTQISITEANNQFNKEYM